MENAIDQQLSHVAHSIDPKDSRHQWQEVAMVISLKDKSQEWIYRCRGCPIEKWVTK